MGPRAGLHIREERKICCPYGIRIPDRPVRNLVTVLTELSRLVLSPVYVKYAVREPRKLRTTAMFVHDKFPNNISHTVCRHVYCLSAWQQTSHALPRCLISYRKAKENGSYRKYSHGRHVIILRLRYFVSGPLITWPCCRSQLTRLCVSNEVTLLAGHLNA